MWIALSTLVSATPQTDYDILDHTVADKTNFNLPVTQGVDVAILPVPPFYFVYACNTFADHIAAFEVFDGANPFDTAPTGRFPTPPGPVAVKHLVRNASDPFDDELLVVCRAANCLVRMDPRSGGEILDLIRLPAEPAHLVVTDDETLAYVSCAGTYADPMIEDDVVRIDIDPASPTFFTITDEWDVPSKRPTWLSIRDLGTSHQVFVAPLISGNNTTFTDHPWIGEAVIPGTLPDQDLFRIDSTTNAIDVIATGLGTTIAGHGWNPASVGKELWVASTDLLNAIPLPALQLQESQLQNDFAVHELTRFDPDSTAAPTVDDLNPGFTPLLLPDGTPSGQRNYSTVTNDMVATPWGLTVAPTGDVFVVGMTTDRVAVFGSDGLRDFTLVVPDGSIPRTVAVTPWYTAGVRYAFVYCWGTNKVQAFYLDGATPEQPYGSYDIGFDPTPELVQRGRQVFYDSSFSNDNNETCNTCHVDGAADMLGWNLSDLPRDNKGALVTQSLFNLEETGPYHWRGERPTLQSFNGPFDDASAFHGLLGNDCRLSDEDFAAFEAFVFSLRSPANPNQSLDRKLSPVAALGQTNYTMLDTGVGTLSTPQMLTCQDCHTLPTGTSGDVTPENSSWYPVRSHFDVTQLYNGSLVLKDQQLVSDVDPTATGALAELPVLGAGLIHDGEFSTLEDFMNSGFPALEQFEKDEIRAFVEEFDFGMAPAAHAAWLLDVPPNPSPADLAALDAQVAEIASVLPAAAEDVPSIGMVVAPADNIGLRYRFVGNQLFAPDQSGAPRQSLTDFRNFVANQGARFVVYGTPPGNDFVSGIDFDNDGLLNADEPNHQADPWNPDTDDDGDLDGHEVANPGSAPVATIANDPGVGATDTTAPTLVGSVEEVFTNARTHKRYFRASEPVRYVITVTDPAGAQSTVQRDSFSRHNTFVIGDLLPSPNGSTHTYQVDIEMWDQSGNVNAADPDLSYTFFPLTGSVDDAYRIGSAQWTTTQYQVDPTTQEVFLTLGADFLVEEIGTGIVSVPVEDAGIFAEVIKLDVQTDCDASQGVGPAQDTTLKSWQVFNDFEHPTDPAYPTDFGINLAVKPGVDPPVQGTYQLFNGNSYLWEWIFGTATTPDKLLLSSRTDSTGIAHFDLKINLTATGLVAGDEIAIRVLGILPVDASWPQTNHLFTRIELAHWSMPETDVDLRQLEFGF